LLIGLASSPIFPGSAAPCPVVGAFIWFICFFFALDGVWTVVVACANCIPSTRAVLSLHAEAPVAKPAVPAISAAAKAHVVVFMLYPFSPFGHARRVQPDIHVGSPANEARWGWFK
jgi:hypothetical protein